MFSPQELEKTLVLEARMLESALLMNTGKGSFRIRPLPIQAQFAPVYAIAVADADGDGALDLLLAGNLHEVKPEVGRYDANYGLLLKGDGKGGFSAVPSRQSGLYLSGQAREMAFVKAGKEELLLVAQNGDALQAFRFRPGRQSISR
jgi:hypothetical protein